LYGHIEVHRGEAAVDIKRHAKSSLQSLAVSAEVVGL